MATRAEKVEIVDALTSALADAPLSIVAGYSELTVSDMQELRRQMRETGAKFRVVKNSLAILAARQSNAEHLEPFFHGQTAFAFSGEDVIGTARALRGFASANPKMEIRGGVAGGQALDTDRIARLASLFGVEQLQSELVWSIESPISGLVHTLAGTIHGLVYALQERVEQLQPHAEGA